MKPLIFSSLLLVACSCSFLYPIHVTFISENTGDLTIRIWRAILRTNRGQLINELFLRNNTNFSRDIPDDGPYWFEAVIGNDFNNRLRATDDLENDRAYTFCTRLNQLRLREEAND